MVPAVCGVAIEVPERVSAWPPALKPVGSGVMQPWLALVQTTPDWVEGMFNPGAATSGFRPIGKEAPPRGPRELNEASVSAALTTSRVALTPDAPAIVVPSAASMNTEREGIGGST